MKLFEAFQTALQLIEVSPDITETQCPCLAIFEAQNPGVLAQSIKKEEPKILAPWEAAPPPSFPFSAGTTVRLYRFSIIHHPLEMVVSGACGICPECQSLYYYHDEEAPEIKKSVPVVEEDLPCTPDGDCCHLATVKGPAPGCDCICHKD